MNYIRTHLSAWLMAAGTWLAPSYAQQAAARLMQAMQGLPDQIAKGRTGGLIVARWAIDADGEELSRMQEHQAQAAAALVRRDWELLNPKGDQS